MSRIELNDFDRQTIERAREVLAAAEAMWTADDRNPARMLGRLEMALGDLLYIVDRGEQS